MRSTVLKLVVFREIGGVSSFMSSNDNNWLNNGNWSLWSNEKATTLKQFREDLQCSPFEPDLDGRRGIFSMVNHNLFSFHIKEIV